MASSEWEDSINGVVQMMAMVADVMGPVDEMIIGYRKKMIDAGFDEDTAGRLALNVHNYTITQMIKAG